MFALTSAPFLAPATILVTYLNFLLFYAFQAVVQTWFEYIDVESVECSPTATRCIVEWIAQ